MEKVFEMVRVKGQGLRSMFNLIHVKKWTIAASDDNELDSPWNSMLLPKRQNEWDY